MVNDERLTTFFVYSLQFSFSSIAFISDKLVTGRHRFLSSFKSSIPNFIGSLESNCLGAYFGASASRTSNLATCFSSDVVRIKTSFVSANISRSKGEYERLSCDTFDDVDAVDAVDVRRWVSIDAAVSFSVSASTLGLRLDSSRSKKNELWSTIVLLDADLRFRRLFLRDTLFELKRFSRVTFAAEIFFTRPAWTDRPFFEFSMINILLSKN